MNITHALTGSLALCNDKAVRVTNRVRDTCDSCIWSAGLFVFVLLSPLDVMSGGDFFCHAKLSLHKTYFAV